MFNLKLCTKALVFLLPAIFLNLGQTLSAQFSASITPTCVTSFPANICAKPSSAAYCAYEWNTGATTSCITALQAGEFCVTVTHCNGNTSSICRTICARPTALISPTILTICEGTCQDLTVLPGGGGVTYDWGNSTTVQTISICPGTTTTYSVTVTNDQGCSKVATRKVNVVQCVTKTGCEMPTSIEHATEEEMMEEDPIALERTLSTEQVTIMPNPATGMVWVDWSNLMVPVNSLRLQNLQGKTLRTIETPDSDKATIDVSGLPAGIYFLNINHRIFKKLVIAP